jgi:CheY-like chemotaxis protein
MIDTNQVSLLLVDDDPVNLEILVEHLQEAGYHTVTASHGEEGWDILQLGTIPFQAVLLDRKMPGMDGMAVLRKMKSHESLGRFPLLCKPLLSPPKRFAKVSTLASSIT